MQAFQRFSGCVEAVVKAGLTYDTDTDRLAQQLWAAIHGLVSLLILQPDFRWAELNSLISGHVRMLIDGVRKKGQ